MSESETTEDSNQKAATVRSQVRMPDPVPSVQMLVPEFARVLMANHNLNKLVEVHAKHGESGIYAEATATCIMDMAERMATKVHDTCVKLASEASDER